LIAMGEKKPKEGWLARRREQKRLKRERTGDSPQRTAERREPEDTTGKDVANPPLARAVHFASSLATP
jgi:hypothetical protein